MAKRLLLILDIQHAGRKSRPQDLGAAGDVDGNGTVERHEREALYTPRYAAFAEWVTQQRGGTVITLREGEYDERHERANEIARTNPDAMCLHAALHFNSSLDPKSDYGLVVADSRSALGQSASEAIASRMSVLLPELRRVVVGTTAATGSDWPRAWSTIDGIFAGPKNIAGVCFEPAFMSSPAHRALFAEPGLRRIGQALAEGALAWAAAS